MAASELATARPRSSWQCALRTMPADGGHPPPHLAEHRAVLLGRRVADRVGKVDGGGALADGHLDTLAEKVEPGATRILGAPLHVVGEGLRAPHALADLLHRFLARHAELGLEVQVGGGEEDMDPAARRTPDRLAGQVDVALGAARERGDRPGARTWAAISCTLRKSVSDDAGNPASITSTPSTSSCRASRTFSSTERLLPGACSPSLSVVSKTMTLRVMPVLPWGGNESAANPLVRGAPAGLRESCYRLTLLATGTPRNPSRPIRRTGRTPRRTRSRPLRFMSSVSVIRVGKPGVPVAGCIKIPLAPDWEGTQNAGFPVKWADFPQAKKSATRARAARTRHLTHARDSISMQP